MKNIPNKIYLQVDPENEKPETFDELDGITWCVDKINDNDIPYYRHKNSNPVEAEVGKRLLAELRKHYLVEIDTETGEPKADIKTLMKLWDEVNNYLAIKTIGKI